MNALGTRRTANLTPQPKSQDVPRMRVDAIVGVVVGKVEFGVVLTL